MHIPIVRTNLGACDVAICYIEMLAFASACEGTRFIQSRAAESSVPFATIAVPTQIGNSAFVSRLSGYEHSYFDVYADTFVCSNGIIRAASFDDALPEAPLRDFWRCIASMYRYELNRYLVEW